MCLIDTKRFRFTFKPIKVYKVINRDNITPFQNCKIKKFNFTLNSVSIQWNTHQYLFENGFYHSYLTKERAESLIESLIHSEIRNIYPLNIKFYLADKSIVEFFNNKYKIVEGYIIGRYAIGDNNDICSRILILNL